MEKFFSILLCLVLVLSFAGCGGNVKNEEYGSNTYESDLNESPESSVKGFKGETYKKWDSVKGDFENLEAEADREVEAMNNITKEEVYKLVDEIEKGVEELKDGVNDKNEATAKQVYKDAHKLELFAKKGDNDVTREFKNLAKNTKALIKQYYGEADEDYDTVREAVTDGLRKIRDFSDDMWNAFINLFK